MATELLVVRHGESKANERNLFTGHGMYALTEMGRRQAVCVGKVLRSENIRYVYASDLPRAKETATIAAQGTGAEVHIDAGLREIDAGAWEGLPFDKVKELYPEEYAYWFHHSGLASCPGGEAVPHVQARMKDTLETIVHRHPGEKVLIVTHATALRSMMCMWMGKDLSRMQEVEWVPNASITRIIYEEDMHFHDLIPGQTEHLENMITRLPDTI